MWNERLADVVHHMVAAAVLAAAVAIYLAAVAILATAFVSVNRHGFHHHSSYNSNLNARCHR